MQNQPQVQLPPFSQTTGVKCSAPECDCYFFDTVFIIRKVSRFLLHSSEDLLMPISLFRCNSCGTILPESLKIIDPTVTPEMIENKDKRDGQDNLRIVK